MSNASPLTLKLAYSQGLCKRHSWVTHARIDENPAIRGHDLCLNKTCQRQPRLGTWSGRPKTVQNYDRTNMTSSADWTGVKLYSLCGCVWCVLQVRTHRYIRRLFWSSERREPALQCRRQICAPDSSSLKPGLGATEGVLDLGVFGRLAY